MLPKDPFILLSYVNTRLRDRFDCLEDLCEDEDLDRAWLERQLGELGYVYSREHNRFQ